MEKPLITVKRGIFFLSLLDLKVLKTGSALKGSVFVALDQAPVFCLCAEKMNFFSDVFSLCPPFSASFWNELWAGFPPPPDLDLLRMMIRNKWFSLTQRHNIKLIDADLDRWSRECSSVSGTWRPSFSVSLSWPFWESNELPDSLNPTACLPIWSVYWAPSLPRICSFLYKCLWL